MANSAQKPMAVGHGGSKAAPVGDPDEAGFADTSGMLLGRQFVCMIGAYRSGTTWVQLMFSAHPQVCSGVEQTVFSRYVPHLLKVYENEARRMEESGGHHGLPIFWDQARIERFAHRFAEQVYEGMVASKPEATHILDKNPDYSNYVELIDRLLPTTKFIHVIRDGRDVATSMMAANRQMGFCAPEIVGASKDWRDLVLAARKAARFEGRYIEVRYEKMLDDPHGTLRGLFEFVGLPTSDGQVDQIVGEFDYQRIKKRKADSGQREAAEKFFRKGKSGSWREELGPAELDAFDRLAGDLLKELGYAEDGWAGVSSARRLGYWLRRKVAGVGGRLGGAVKALRGEY